MTLWLKQRLAIWLCASLIGGALLWNVGALRAQSKDDPSMLSFDKPRLKFTREQAIKVYTQNLRFMTGKVEFRREDTRPFMSSISHKSRWTSDFNSYPLERAIADQWAKTKRPFVMINEGGYWGVDLVETYAKWNNLRGVAKAKVIFNLTGAILDDLPRDEQFKRDNCQRNLYSIGISMLNYLQDYDMKYPLAKTWTESMRVYNGKKAAFTCPSIPKGQRYGYAYNAKLAGTVERDFSVTSTIVSFYETSILKRNAYGTGEELAFRHLNGANYAFADGHVKWFPKTTIPSFNLK